MSPDMNRYMKAKYGNIPTVEVTEEELLQVFMAAGKSEKDAKFQINMMKGLGSTVMIGDKKYELKQTDSTNE